VARVSIGEFVRQVKGEGIQKVVWPTRQETFRTTVLVLIMTGRLSPYVLATASLFSEIGHFLRKQLG
jgi:preprotein translocase subunit SecE